MRLTCPNCGAQYEVDDNVIPDGGRDVQCSNCGHTWYERGAARRLSREPSRVTEPAMAEATADAAAETTAETAAAAPEPAAPESETETSDAPETAAAPETEDAVDEDEADEAFEAAARPVDEGIASILREEAERETSARASEAEALESQTEMGLDGTSDSTVPEHVARMRDQGDDLGASVAAAAVGVTQRSELLPDIDEINSTLDADANDGGEIGAVARERRERSSFRRGFALVVIIFAVLTAIYVLAPRIADAYPPSAPALASYVDWVNGLRVSVDGALQSAVDRLTSLVAQISDDR